MMGTGPTARSCGRCGARLATDNAGSICRPCQRAARVDGISPPEVPPEFWDSEQLRVALQERHIGHVVRSYRRHPFHGRRPIPQEVAARWLGISQAQLARIEHGRPVTDLNRLVQWSKILRIPQELLWFTVPVDEPDERGEVKRRQFLAATVFMPEISRAAITGSMVRQTTEFVPDSDLRNIVHDMTALRGVLTRQDNILGASAVAPTVTHQLAILGKLSSRSAGEARGLLTSLRAAYAEFGSWLADELGDRNAGQFWIDRAIDWSHEAADDLMIGYILARKAQRAIDENDPAAAIGLARAAQRHNVTDRVRAAALQYQALGHASTAETAKFCDAIGRARELVDSLSPAKEDEWAMWCTPEYVSIHEANGWVRLGAPARAVAAYQQALANWSHEFLRDEGVYYGRLARAQVLARNPEGAEQAARKALGIAARTGSARILAELALLPGALSEWKDSVSVRKFREDLISALTRQDET